MNAELALLGAVAMAPPGFEMALALAATLGQFTGQSALYCAGAGALRLPGARFQRTLQTVEQKLGSWHRGKDAVFFTSAVLGLPPFYLVSIASGVARYPIGRFASLGLLGRFLRFAALALAPSLLLRS